jgi:predicted TIM-barrel fold metal-dependent hydrolase
MRVTLDAIARSGGNYRGTAIIDTSYSEKDFERMHRGGIRGVRFNFVRHLGGRPDMGFFKSTVERLKRLGWHLILHLDAVDLVEFESTFRSLPVPFVIDHMGRVKAADGLGQPPFRILLDFLKQKNAWVKICGAERVSSAGPPFTDAVPFAQGADRRGARARAVGHRLAAPEREMDARRCRAARVVPADGARRRRLQKQILVDNPARLYGF